MGEISASGIRVIDGALCYPKDARANALSLQFGDFDAGDGTIFHGIARPNNFAMCLPEMIAEHFPQLKSTLTFFRRSPLGQAEPNFVHTDIGMGDWTGILYLNENPPDGDGTAFWKHRITGKMFASATNEHSAEWRDSGKWERWHHVAAAFNRLLLFPAGYFHSRGMYSNYGSGNDARLIQVVFGKGDLWLSD